MIAPRLLAFAIHALLHDGPAAVIGDNESVQVKIEAVLHRRAVDLCHQPARLRERRAIKSDAVTDAEQFLRRLP